MARNAPDAKARGALASVQCTQALSPFLLVLYLGLSDRGAISGLHDPVTGQKLSRLHYGGRHGDGGLWRNASNLYRLSLFFSLFFFGFFSFG